MKIKLNKKIMLGIASVVLVVLVVMSLATGMHAAEASSSISQGDTSAASSVPQSEEAMGQASSAESLSGSSSSSANEEQANLPAFAAAAAAADVTDVIPDLLLRKIINNSIDWTRPADTPISALEMESLLHLSIYGDYLANSTEPRVTSLEGMQYAVNIENLDISYQDLSDPDALAPLQNLTKLVSLNIGSSQLTSESLRHLVNLTNLQSVQFNHNPINSFKYLEPLFQQYLDRYISGEVNVGFSMYGYSPISDYTGSFPLYQMNYLRYLSYAENPTSADVAMAEYQATHQVMRGIWPFTYSMTERLNPVRDVVWGENDIAPIQLPTIYASSEDTVVPVKTNIIDLFGDRALFVGSADWKADPDNFLQAVGFDAYAMYMAAKTNGFDNAYDTMDLAEDYFTLKTRPSADYPGVDEYYYEGRDFNIVPYNPYATGASDFQSAIASELGEWYASTVYYFEFKNIREPQPIPGKPGMYYPSPYSFDAEGVTISISGTAFVTENRKVVYNSSQYTLFQQKVVFYDPLDPVITGFEDKTVTQGDALDFMAGVLAVDPTRDGNNIDGATPFDITADTVITGAVDLNKPGVYTQIITVTTKYNRTATVTRTITVKEPIYYVTLVYGNGQASVTKQQLPGSYVNHPGNPIREGYTFLGWVGEGKNWIFGEDVMPKGNLAIYAFWQRDVGTPAPVSSSKNPVYPVPPVGSSISSSSSASSSSVSQSVSSAISSSTSGNASSSSVPTSSAVVGGNTGGSGQGGGWSLINLIAIVANAALLAAMFFMVSSRRRNAKLILLPIATLVFIVTLVIKIVTSDFAQPMLVFNNLSPLFIVSIVLQTVLMVIYSRKTNGKDGGDNLYEDDEYYGSPTQQH